MKKRILYILLIIMLCLALIVNFLLKSKYIMSNNLIGLGMKEESLTKTKATLILENYTDSQYMYGVDYTIERKVLGNWYILIPKKKISHNLIAYNLHEKEFKEIEIEWEYEYGRLIPGKYRIIKKVFLKKEATTEPTDIKDFEPIVDLYTGVEFIIR